MIRNFVTDCDGVLTDGKVCYTDKGKVSVEYHSNDSYAFKQMMNNGIRVIMVSSASRPEIHEQRAKDLGVEFYSVTLEKKLDFVVDTLGIDLDETAYSGDCYDDVDLLVSARAGFVPANAIPGIKVFGTVLGRGGGEGCVLEIWLYLQEINNGECS